MNEVGILVEGDLDEAVARRLVSLADLSVNRVYPKRGFGYIKSRLDGFRRAADALPVLALVDLMDTGLDCPADVVSTWLRRRNPNLVFRVVTREIESWLLADREGIASFLSVDPCKFPADPEELPDPKRAVVNLARRSRSSVVRRALVPAKESGAVVGPRYTGELAGFARHGWDPLVASARAESLHRCIRAIGGLRDRL